MLSMIYLSNMFRIISKTLLIEFCCPVHNSSGRKWVCQTVSNIYFNSEQKILNAEIQKDDIKKSKACQCGKTFGGVLMFI